MKTLTHRQEMMVEAQLGKFFAGRAFKSFLGWLEKQWEENPRALLSVNPPNHVYDCPDGSMDMTIGEEAATLKREHQKSQEGTIFSYRIRCEGGLREVIRGISTLSDDEKLEAAMSLWVEKEGYLSNAPAWRDLEKQLRKELPDGLDNNPFYRRVCERILKEFEERGWM